jgi:hypothetical protein
MWKGSLEGFISRKMVIWPTVVGTGSVCPACRVSVGILCCIDGRFPNFQASTWPYCPTL